MRYLMLLFFLGLGFAVPTAAQAYPGCDDRQITLLKDALRGAKDLTLKAAVSVGDTPEYTRWFGTYSDDNAERVRASLKSVMTVLRGGTVTAQCEPARSAKCANSEYAFVYPDAPYLIHFCQSYFRLPGVDALRPDDRRSENGTREGTIIHEVTHFMHVAATEDHCYSRSLCSEMAMRHPRNAIDNADSYQYFAEDVMFFARQPVAGKPAIGAGVTR